MALHDLPRTGIRQDQKESRILEQLFDGKELIEITYPRGNKGYINRIEQVAEDMCQSCQGVRLEHLLMRRYLLEQGS